MKTITINSNITLTATEKTIDMIFNPGKIVKVEAMAKADDHAIMYEGTCVDGSGCTWAEIDGKTYNVGPFVWEFYELLERVRG